MRSAVRVLCLMAATASILLGSAPLIQAQEPPPPDSTQAADADADDLAPPAGYVSAVEGTAHLDREGEPDAAERGMPIVAGDRVRTDAGRIEITLADGTRLHLDRFSEIDLPSDLVVRLARGRLLVTINAGVADRVSVEAPGALARFEGDGQYRVAIAGEDAVEVELAVLRGAAEISSEAGAVRLGTGERSRVRDGDAPSRPDTVAATPTTLERWADELMASSWQSSTSQTYLPTELDTYANTFDRYGSWQADATYGHVWYPSVEVDWRPYYNGRWDHLRGYGWTWISGDPWGYPTHHYGRWQLNVRGSWFWVPSRRWGPAWVYWATTPTYVGWCPLGWNGRPVVSVFTYGGTVRSYGRGRDPYRAWTVLPTGRFGRSPVPHYRVDRTILDREQPRFVMQHVPPGFAPSRSPYRRASSDQRPGGVWGEGAPARRPGVTSPRGSSAADTTHGATYRRSPRSRDDANGSGGWSNYRAYERQMQEAGGSSADTRDRSGRGTSGSAGGWSNYREYERRMRDAGNGRDTGDRDRSDARPPAARSPGYTRPTDPGPRPDSGRPARGDTDGGRPSPGYAAPRGGSGGGSRGGDRGASAPRPSGGGSEARRGDSGSRGGDAGGSRGGAAPRRRP